jgi:hypothetical protein
MNIPAKISSGDIMEQVIIKGDLAKLAPEERVRYYGEVCRSVGLNPLTKPFEFISLNGKLVLYATRTCGDQLRKINGVSLEIVSRVVTDDVMTIHVRARLPDGRCDEDYGSVFYPSSLKGEARANAELKCVTKAKRRATLSICGLGWLDELEIETIPVAAEGFRKQAAETRRKLGGAHEVVWDDDSVREPTPEEIKEVGEERSDSWGHAQGDRMLNAVNARPEHDADGVVSDSDPTSKNQFLATTREYIRTATDANALAARWNSAEEKQARRDFELTRNEAASIRDFCEARIKALKG